jgi:hypothetical protein
MTRKMEQADVRVPYLPPLKATDALAENFPRTPPPRPKSYFCHQFIPRKISEKFEKVAPYSCGEMDNYLTNEGIDAIVQTLSSNPVTAP